ncbi:efflux RND transporter periplasmic adaptor subunit [Lutibacter maritimus]|uniref:Membrane fusion protein, cobalt-zinc-cadmium efflux system n=1 Tax=Lutibacter maritimus TaxID=593133 RepID=A0A1I6Q000_9FLAO|nr:efflux RND transporter periplasmic adaptor subunit [Lutibacter maritimus]SFS45786.1 membrane fusion protein, cobalt-zinc-cadmium efflux system [Lutibacter maritimus]
MKNILKISTLLILLFTIISCGNSESKHTEGDENKSEQTKDVANEEETPNKVALKLNQLEIMGIALGNLSQLNLGASLKVNGQLELPPQNMASVSAIIGGRVQSVSVVEGDFVKKGQVIATLNNPEFISMQRAYLAAKSNLTYLEKDYVRKKELEKEGITSARAFQESEAAYLNAKADLNATKATLYLIGINVSSIDKGVIIASIPVIAPIQGYIQKIEINIGKSVAPEQEMFEIVDNNFLHLGLNVFEKDIEKLSMGQKIAFTLSTRPNKIYEAEIFALGKAFDLDTRSVKVHAKIIGTHEGLLTGMFVEARIATDSKLVDALPDEAFVNEKGLDYIFIQIEKDEDDLVLEKIQVIKGVSDLGFSEVQFPNPMEKNILIVTKGAYYVNSELNKGEFEGHDH